MHIRQPEVSTRMMICQTLMIKAHQMQHRRMQIKIGRAHV